MRFLFNEGKCAVNESVEIIIITVKMLVLTIPYHAPNESLLCAAKKMLQVLCKVSSLNLLQIILNTTSFFVMLRVIIIINRKPESTSFHSNCCIFIYLDYSKSETDVFLNNKVVFYNEAQGYIFSVKSRMCEQQ